MSSRRTQKLRRRASPLLSKINDDLYTVLDVKKTASAKEIKKAYRRMAIRLHPDVNPGPEVWFIGEGWAYYYHNTFMLVQVWLVFFVIPTASCITAHIVLHLITPSL